MAEKLKPEAGAAAGGANIGHNVGDLKEVMQGAAKSFLRINEARKELNDEAAEIREKLKNSGVHIPTFMLSLRLYQMDSTEQADYMASLHLSNDALSIGAQTKLFMDEDMPEQTPPKDAKPAAKKGKGKGKGAADGAAEIPEALAKALNNLAVSYEGIGTEHAADGEVLIYQAKTGGEYISMAGDVDAIVDAIADTDAALPDDRQSTIDTKDFPGHGMISIKVDEVAGIVNALLENRYPVVVVHGDGQVEKHQPQPEQDAA